MPDLSFGQWLLVWSSPGLTGFTVRLVSSVYYRRAYPENKHVTWKRDFTVMALCLVLSPWLYLPFVFAMTALLLAFTSAILEWFADISKRLESLTMKPFSKVLRMLDPPPPRKPLAKAEPPDIDWDDPLSEDDDETV